MAWENVEERLKRTFKVRVSFPAGAVWLPNAQVDIDDWLTSAAETDEELRELNIPRIQFLQNHWPIENLLELEWDNQFSNRRALWAMYIGRYAFILFSDWIDYQLVAAIEPRDRLPLYRMVIGNVLRNPEFVPTPPEIVINHRPDILPEVLWNSDETKKGDVPTRPKESRTGHLLTGWIGAWLNLPVIGYWHKDVPEPATNSEKENSS